MAVTKPKYLMTAQTNPGVLAVLFANGICSNSEYLTYEEAAAITTFPSKLFLKANTIASFDELEFFGITSIPVACFNTCSVTSITLSDKITNIAGSAIRNCTNLQRIICKAATPPTCAGNAVFNNTNPSVVYVPAGSVDAYKVAHGWDNFANIIQAIPN